MSTPVEMDLPRGYKTAHQSGMSYGNGGTRNKQYSSGGTDSSHGSGFIDSQGARDLTQAINRLLDTPIKAYTVYLERIEIDQEMTRVRSLADIG